MTEPERLDAMRRNPILSGFLSTLLEDLQYSEDDEACTEGREGRDTGTIWDCPPPTFKAAAEICERFLAHDGVRDWLANELGTLWSLSSRRDKEGVGYDLYLTCAGHGAGFWDGRWPLHGNALTAAAMAARQSLETYIGDDGGAYIYGMENEETTK